MLRFRSRAPETHSGGENDTSTGFIVSEEAERVGSGVNGGRSYVGAGWPWPQVVGIWGTSACEYSLASPMQSFGAVGTGSFLPGTGQAVATGPTCLRPGRSILCSRSIWFWGGSPTQALRDGSGLSRATRSRRPPTPAAYNCLGPVHSPMNAHLGQGWGLESLNTPENVFDAATLAEERIDYGAAGRHKWSLEQEAKQR